MGNWLYIDTEATQQGPIDDSTLLSLGRNGGVVAGSLLWREGMEEWVPFREVASSLLSKEANGDASGVVGVPVEIGVCAYSGQVYPVREMLPYGEALIGPEHKETFLQHLMEGAVVGIRDATQRPVEYIGFWWRSLSSLLDYMIKMIPSGLCMIPYYAVAIAGGASPNTGGDDLQSLTGWTSIMLIAYGLGLIGVLALSIFYDTWMVGKYQATLGKIIIGVKVVNPDGSRLTYKRAFVRWLAKKPLNYFIVWIPSTVGFGVVIAVIVAASKNNSENPSGFLFAMLSGLFIYFALLALCSGVYWMAALDPEKRAMHDRIASTRVVRK